MCGFLITRTKRFITDHEISVVSNKIKRRGPDGIGSWRSDDSRDPNHFQMTHFLLDISGRSVYQPLVVDGRFVFLFNGELFGHEVSSRKSDTESLAEHILLYGPNCLDSLAGEYVVCLYDKDLRELRVITDDHMTKPVYIGRGDDPAEFGLASYPSALTSLGFGAIHMLQPNGKLTISFDNIGELVISESHPVRGWNTVETHETFEDWELKFRNAVRRYATHGSSVPTVFLSSGYDSGAICLALNLEMVPYRTISLLAGESMEVVSSRLAFNSNFCIEPKLIRRVPILTYPSLLREMRECMEPFFYTHGGAEAVRSIFEDQGAIAGFYLAKVAHSLGIKVVLSGCGADEIYSDYGFDGVRFYGHSEFGGDFSHQTAKAFPWKKFYGDTLRSYLMKDEIVLGAHGIEGRYPFLCREVVQSFLNFPVSKKNSSYKAPIEEFFKKHNYPYEKNKKRGFSSGLTTFRALKNRLRVI